ncbi:MAG: pyridoxal-phosphate dependent enzyme [Alphaproteobacteria bacterium]|nr:pyridoxal-phosphate dependent enzyme [Alphaproteobacteria bacterium]
MTATTRPHMAPTCEPAWSLVCELCGRAYPAFAACTGCPDCARAGRAGVLEVSGCLPRRGDPGALTLGEGRTPLVEAPAIARRLGLARLHFKIEGTNPTGSYKDRYVAATLNAILPFGVRRIVVSSTGNLGVAAVAYAAAAGLPCLFLAAAGLPGAALIQAQSHGATVVMTDPVRRHVVFEHAALHRGWFPIGLRMPRRISNPFGVEGYRGIAEEVLADLGQPPDAVLFPSARGNGLFGAWLGFRDRPGTRPRMIACQPDTANSLEASLRGGLDVPAELPPSDSVAFSTRETTADVMALRAIRASGGTAVSASDAEILAAQADLARAGLFVEPSSALPLACLPRLIASGALRRDAAVVCVLTASGVRWAEHLPGLPPVPRIDPTAEALDRFLSEAGLAD